MCRGGAGRGGFVKMCVRVWNEERLSTQMENGPVALALHTAAC